MTLKILTIDDSPTIRAMLDSTLTEAGFEVYQAENGRDGLGMLGVIRPDIVITDINMPNMSGIELTEIIKRDYDPDVIVMTGFGVDTTYDKIIEKGASDFIQKPVGVREMILRIERLLTERVTLSHRLRAEKELRESYKRLKRILDQTVRSLTSALAARVDVATPAAAPTMVDGAAKKSACGHPSSLTDHRGVLFKSAFVVQASSTSVAIKLNL